MKKYISAILMATLLSLSIPLFAGQASAQTRRYDGRRYSPVYSPYETNSTFGRQGVYDRHRKAINIAASTGVGAVLGALLGGGKGALIGAAAGAAGGAIITSKQRPRNYYRVY